MSNENQEFDDFYIDMKIDEVDPWGGDFHSVAPGQYVVEIVGVTRSTSAGKNTPQMTVTYEVKEPIGDRAEANAEEVGRTIKAWYNLENKKGSRQRIRALSDAALGANAWDKHGGLQSADLIGCQMVVEVFTNSWSQKDPVTQEEVVKSNTKVKNERPLDAANALRDDDDVKSVDAADADDAPKNSGRNGATTDRTPRRTRRPRDQQVT